MSNSNLRIKSSGTKVFLVSGVTEDIRKDLAKKINQLGGKYFDLQYYKAICTHVICGKLSKSEKFLGGCACGKWVLHPDFIHQSVAAGAWLDEEQFEWCDEHILRQFPGVEPEMYFASRRWRFELGEENRGAFNGWKVAVVAGAKKSQVIKRLLISGGAEVLNLKLPVQNAEKVANTLGYIFVSQQNVAMVARLFDYGVLCVKPEFIADYLLKYPQPDPMDYLVQYTPATQSAADAQDDLGSEGPGSQDSFLVASQLDNTPSTPATPTTQEFGATTDLVNEEPIIVNNRRQSSRVLKSSTAAQPSSQLFPSAKIKQEAVWDDDDVVQIDITPQARGGSKASASQCKPDLDGLVIDLAGDDDDSYSCITDSRTTTANHPTAAAQGTGTDLNRRSSRSRAAKAPAWKQLMPRSRVKLVDDLSDDKDGEIMGRGATATCSAADLEGLVADLASGDHGDSGDKATTADLEGLLAELASVDHSDSEDNQATAASQHLAVAEVAETRANRRKSRHCTTKSPAWKQLIPRSRIKSAENADEKIKADGSSESLVNEVKDKVTSNNTNRARRSLSLGNNESPTVPKEGSNTKEADKENLKGSQERVTSTPAKRVLGRKLSKSELIATMSPITSFFKPLVRTVGARTSYISFEIGANSQATVKPDTGIVETVPQSQPVKSSSTGSVKEAAPHSQPVKSASTGSVKEAIPQSQPIKSVSVGSIAVPHNQPVKSASVGSVETAPHSQPVKSASTGCAAVPHSQPVRSARGRRRTTIAASSQLISKADPDSSVITSGDSQGSDKTTQDVEIVDAEMVTTPAVREDASTPQASGGMAAGARVSRKRKSSEDPSLHQLVREQKRQKISLSEWRPTKFSINFEDEKNQHDRLCMRRATTDIIMTTFEEEEFTLIALQELNSRISQLYFPTAETLALIIHKVLPAAETEVEASLAAKVLTETLRLHPPVTMEMQHIYLQALAGGGAREERGVAEDWHTIHTCIRMILNEDNLTIKRNYCLLFELIKEMLQLNLQYFILSGEVKQGTKHMWLRVLWCPSYHVVFNNRCRELVDLMMDTLGLYQTETSHENKGILLELLQSIVWMVAMAAECCRLEESKVVRGVRALQAEKVSAFVHEISRRLIDANLQDCDLLQCILGSLQLPWLCVGICQQLLNTLDDYLLADDMLRDTAVVTLSVIVSRYFFLLPRMRLKLELKDRAASAAKQGSGQEQKGRDTPTKCLYENTDMNVNGMDKQIGHVNKKNAKGETQLHRACIAGNVAKVKMLLHIPGIDVNARDNFGWTPLHEACNHGNVECVREMLKFVPSKSVVQYFNKGHKISKVDLLACNEEGITPLHDAVLNGRLEVARLLLQHGGSRLLAATTTLGYMPLHLANTEEMRAMLSSFEPLRRRMSEDSVIGSQDSISSIDEVRMPTDTLYDEVLNADGARIFVDSKALVTYIHLTTSLVYSYCTAVGLDRVKPQVNPHRNSQGRQASQECLNSSSLPYDRTSCDDVPMNASEKENIPSSCVTRCGDNIPRTLLWPPESLEHLDKEDRTILKKDLKVVRYMGKFLNMFHDHLFKLCHVEDRPVVDYKLLDLNCLVDHLQDK